MQIQAHKLLDDCKLALTTGKILFNAHAKEAYIRQCKMNLSPVELLFKDIPYWKTFPGMVDGKIGYNNWTMQWQVPKIYFLHPFSAGKQGKS